MDDDENYETKLSYIPSKSFAGGDVFGISFDFINDIIRIYHNGYKIPDQISSKGNRSRE